MPQFGFRTNGFREWTAEESVAELARLGYDCVEVCLERPDVRPELLSEARCAELRQTIRSLGIGIASVSYHGDADPFVQRALNQEKAVWATRWLGSRILVINGEKSVDQERQWAEHVPHFKALCELAEKADVTLAVEPEPERVIGSSEDALAMMGAVGSPRLKVNLDVGHAQLTDDSLAESVRRLGSAIVHLHLEDIQGRVHKHLLFGEGDVDFAALRQALAEIGYAGPYVVDLSRVDDPSQVATQALGGLRRLFGSPCMRTCGSQNPGQVPTP